MTARSGSLVVRNLTKRYGDLTVLDSVDLEAPQGRVTVVTGSNGSGKSTLLRCVAGLASHTGTVSFQGEPIGRVRHLMGYLPQSVGLAGWATVGETVAHFARLRGAEPAEIGLPASFVPADDRKVGVLSGGQRQRVALAIALLGRPRLLLLDEPSANLDDSSRAALWAVLSAAASDGATVVIATPVDTDLGILGRDVVEIVDGRIQTADSPREGTAGNGVSPSAADEQRSRK